MNINFKYINVILQFLIIPMTVLFLPATSSATQLKHQVTKQNINIAKHSNEIVSNNYKIATYIMSSIDIVKLATVSKIFGPYFIYEINSSGFSVNTDTTIEELLSTQNSDNFITNWIIDNPQEIDELLNKIGKKLIINTSLFKHELDYHNKLKHYAEILSALSEKSVDDLKTPNLSHPCLYYVQLIDMSYGGYDSIDALESYNEDLDITICCNKYWLMENLADPFSHGAKITMKIRNELCTMTDLKLRLSILLATTASMIIFLRAIYYLKFRKKHPTYYCV